MANDKESIVDSISSKMAELKSLVDGSQALTQKDKQTYGEILAQYQGFVDVNLNQAPGEEKSQKVTVPFHAGSNDVEPCL